MAVLGRSYVSVPHISRGFTIPPIPDVPVVVNITTIPSLTRLSRVSGRDVVVVGFTTDANYQAYELKVVPNANSTRNEGALIEAGGGGTGGVERTVDVTDDELVAAEGAVLEGTKVIKAFVRNMAGSWSDGGVSLLMADTMLSADTMLVAEGVT